jgi:hypothetical protein
MGQPLWWKWRECHSGGGEAATPNNPQSCPIGQQKRLSDTLNVNFAISDRGRFAVVSSASSRRRDETWPALLMINAAGVLRRPSGDRFAVCATMKA